MDTVTVVVDVTVLLCCWRCEHNEPQHLTELVCTRQWVWALELLVMGRALLRSVATLVSGRRTLTHSQQHLIKCSSTIYTQKKYLKHANNFEGTFGCGWDWWRKENMFWIGVVLLNHEDIINVEDGSVESGYEQEDVQYLICKTDQLMRKCR